MRLWIVWKRHWNNIPEDNNLFMKKIFLFLLIMPVSYAAVCQYFILDKRAKIKKNMEKFYAAASRQYAFIETDSTVSYTLTDSLSLPATTVFYFNEQNRCVKQENIFSCDSCMQQSMQRSLDGKFVNWEKISTGRYYAAFPYNTVMEQLIINDQYVVRFSRQKKKDAKYAVAE